MVTMVYQEQFRNSIIFLSLTMTMMISCSPKKIRHLEQVNEESSQCHQSGGLMYVDGELFSGQLFKLYASSKDTMYVRGYMEGKRNGEWRKYYPGLQMAEIRFFKDGQKTGLYRGWWPYGEKKFEYTFRDDEYHGVLKEWNPEGKLVREMNYKKGHEDGAQKVWYDNGKIKSNYVVKNGRRYGLLGTKNCVNISDSLFVD